MRPFSLQLLSKTPVEMGVSAEKGVKAAWPRGGADVKDDATAESSRQQLFKLVNSKTKSLQNFT